MIDDLAISLLQEWNNKVLVESYTASFDHYVKVRFPRSYEMIIREVKYHGYALEKSLRDGNEGLL